MCVCVYVCGHACMWAGMHESVHAHVHCRVGGASLQAAAKGLSHIPSLLPSAHIPSGHGCLAVCSTQPVIIINMHLHWHPDLSVYIGSLYKAKHRHFMLLCQCLQAHLPSSC